MSKTRAGKLLMTVGAVLFVIFAFLLICNRSMLVSDNHDEHQFMASGYLLATKGLLPYRDYPYFHMPNLIFVYALIDKLTGFKLLYTRIFSALFGTLTVALLSASTFFFFEKKSLTIRFVSALLAGLFLLANPLFAGTSGLAWNHDVPVFFTLLAVLAYFRSKDSRRPFVLIAVSGGLLGIAIGSRSSFATIIPAFLLTLKFHPQVKTWRSFWVALFSFTLGGAIAMLPAIVLFCLAPKNFIFGNIGYAGLNSLYRQQTGYTDGMDKIAYLSQVVLSQNANLLILAGLLVFVLLPAWMEYRKSRSWQFTPTFLALLPVFAMVGSLLPTPSFPQYFYAPVPLIILGSSYTISRFESEVGSKNNLYLQFFTALILVSAWFGLRDISVIRNTLNAQNIWYPYTMHWQAEKLTIKVASPKILTLAPIYAIEAGKEIYPEFATGPFAFRIAFLLSVDERRQYKIIAPADLEEFLRSQPPGGILTGRDPDIEMPLINYAVSHGYKMVAFRSAYKLWVR